MRKKINIILICAALSLVFASGAFASSSSTQVTCDGTVKAVYPGAHDKHRPDKSVFIQNQEPSIPVYVGPAATITIHNGGILLSSSTANAVILDSVEEAWYCVTAGNIAQVGVTVRN